MPHVNLVVDYSKCPQLYYQKYVLKKRDSREDINSRILDKILFSTFQWMNLWKNKNKKKPKWNLVTQRFTKDFLAYRKNKLIKGQLGKNAHKEIRTLLVYVRDYYDSCLNNYNPKSLINVPLSTYALHGSFPLSTKIPLVSFIGDIAYLQYIASSRGNIAHNVSRNLRLIFDLFCFYKTQGYVPKVHVYRRSTLKTDTNMISLVLKRISLNFKPEFVIPVVENICLNVTDGLNREIYLPRFDEFLCSRCPYEESCSLFSGLDI